MDVVEQGSEHDCVKMGNEEKLRYFFDKTLERISEHDTFYKFIQNLMKAPNNNLGRLKYLTRNIFKEEQIHETIISCCFFKTLITVYANVL